MAPPRPPDRRVYAPRYRGPSRPPDVPTYKAPAPRLPSSVVKAAGAPRRPAAPDYLGQAQTQVSGILDPQLAYIANHYNQQAQGVSSAMQGQTDSYAAWLGAQAGSAGAPQAQAQQTISAAANGINAQLTQVGQTSANTEAASAAQAGQAAGGQSPDINLAAAGKGAGGAAGAIGQAAINALAAEQKAAIAYASKLPGFAQLEGHQQIASALATLSAQMADQMAQTTAQAPQLFYTIYQNLLDRAQTDKEFQFQLRQYNDKVKAQKASIVSSTAPTLAGRNAYWQGVAAQRTKESGDQWIATNTGIRPVDADPSKPGIQRVRSTTGISADSLVAARNASSTATTVRANAAATTAQTAITKEKNRHAEALARIATAQKNAKTAEQRAALAKQQAAETARHNRATEAISKASGKKTTTKKGSTKKTPPKTIYGN